MQRPVAEARDHQDREQVEQHARRALDPVLRLAGL
jgi:hypothetical protein